MPAKVRLTEILKPILSWKGQIPLLNELVLKTDHKDYELLREGRRFSSSLMV